MSYDEAGNEPLLAITIKTLALVPVALGDLMFR